jgi:ferredoxin-like protein FixX
MVNDQIAQKTVAKACPANTYLAEDVAESQFAEVD